VAVTTSSQSAAAAGATTPAEVLAFARDRNAEMVDLKFVDLPGQWQHMNLPLVALEESDFEAGLGFDGSSIRGFQEIHESDMLLVPDSTTAFIDPFYTPTYADVRIGRLMPSRELCRAGPVIRRVCGDCG
jgi:glutamine synthetase